MRRLILFNFVTLDGFFEGPKGQIDWHQVDGEFNDFSIEQLNQLDLIILGRKTYQLMESYWTSKEANSNDPIIAGFMNSKPKIVISTTLKSAAWNNTVLLKDNIAEEIAKLKNQPGKDIFIFGSALLADSFTNLGLIDEYRIMINPVVLGSGSTLFKPSNKKLGLSLIKTKIFDSGNVLLYYQPKNK